MGLVRVNRVAPQGTVLGPILFSVMVNDIGAVWLERNLLFLISDDLTLSIPVNPRTPLFPYAIEVWVSTTKCKYLSPIDRFCRPHAFKYGCDCVIFNPLRILCPRFLNHIKKDPDLYHPLHFIKGKRLLSPRGHN